MSQFPYSAMSQFFHKHGSPSSAKRVSLLKIGFVLARGGGAALTPRIIIIILLLPRKWGTVGLSMGKYFVLISRCDSIAFLE